MDAAPEQNTRSLFDMINIKQEPEMAQEQYKSSDCDPVTIKQEPVEPDSLAYPNEEIEYIPVKEETPVRSEKQYFLRISTVQRMAMLQFMKSHTALATGKFAGPEGAKQKQRLLQQLSAELNSLPNGATKTTDKWMKLWQDWRSDVKAKASLIKKEMEKTGGGLITKVKPLTSLEQQLLDSLGPCVVSGYEDVPDLLTIARQDSGHIMRNDTDDEDATGGSDYVVLPLEGSTMMYASDIPSGNISPSLIMPPLASPDDSVPSTSGFGPALHVTGSSSTKKRKRRFCGTSSAKDKDPLVDITRQQLICMQEQNAIRREQLLLDKRRTAAIETAAQAFVGTMKTLEEYLRQRHSE